MQGTNASNKDVNELIEDALHKIKRERVRETMDQTLR